MKNILLVLSSLLPFGAFSQAVNDSCYQAIEIFCGDAFSVDFGGYDPYAYDYFEDCSFYSYNSRVWYQIEGTGDIVHLLLCNYSPSMLVLEGECEALECVDNVMAFDTYPCGFNSDEKAFKSEAGKTYYIYCNTINPGLPSDLSVSCFTPAVNNFCEQATPIEINTTYSYNHLTAYPSGHPASPFQISYAFGDTWYTFVGTGELLMLDNVPSDHYLVTTLLKGDCNNYEVVPADFFNNRSAFQTEAGQTYYLQITAANSEDRYFSLTPLTLADNHICAGARNYSLGETLSLTLDSTLYSELLCSDYETRGYGRWYAFSGQDGIITLSISPYNNPSFGPLLKVLSGDCDNMICESTTASGNSISFKGEAGKNYRLQIINVNAYDFSRSFTLTSSVNKPVVNDDYTGAIPLTCGSTLSGDIRYALGEDDIQGFVYPTLWYQVTGADEFVTISAQFQGISLQLSPMVFTLENGQITFYQEAFNNALFLQKDQIYYIAVQNTYAYLALSYPLDLFSISMECTAVLENDVCSTALAVALTDTISGTTAFSLINPEDACSPASLSDGWYTFTGDGGLKDIIFERSAYFQNLSLAKGSCDALECVPFVLQQQLGDQLISRVHLEEGVQYYLKIYNAYSNLPDYPFTFYFRDIAIDEHDLCSNARELSCGSVVQDSLDYALAGDLLCDGQASTDPGIWYHLKGDGKYYELRFTQSVYADIENEVDATLYQGNCQKLKCIDDQMKTYFQKFVFLAAKGKDYYLLVRRLQKINFEVSCVDAPDNDNFMKAIDVSCGETYSGYHFSPTYTALATCENDQEKIPDIWFTIKGRNEFLYVDRDYQMRGGLYQVYTREKGKLQCFGLIDYYQSRIFLPAGKQYYLRLVLPTYHSYAYAYDYKMTFSCHPKASNDDCLSAIELSCGASVTADNTHATNDSTEFGCQGTVPGTRSIWYTINGDDSWKDIRIESPLGETLYPQVWTFEGSCNELTCLYQQGNIFFAEAGKRYYININGDLGPMNISLVCADGAANDLCKDAQVISCGEFIQGTLDYATLCDYDDDCPDGYLDKNVWYELTGDGNIVNLQLLPYAYNAHTVDMLIYHGDCCTLPPVENIYGTQHNKYFLTEAGEKYLIAIKLGATWDIGRFDLTINCADPDDYSICENAEGLDDQQIHTINPNKQLPYLSEKPYYPDVVTWVYFTGSGATDTLLLSEMGYVDFIPHVQIDLDNNCKLTTELNGRMQRLDQSGDEVKYIIQTTAGLRYMIGLQGVEFQNPEFIKVQFKSGDIPNACTLSLPEQLSGEYQGSIEIGISIAGDEGPFDIFLLSGKGFTWTSSYHYGIENNTTVTFWPSSAGYVYVEFWSAQCHGHAVSLVNLANVPVKGCQEEEASNSPVIKDLPPVSAPQSITPIEVRVFPNPFSHATKVSFNLPQVSYCQVQIYDMRGNLMTQLLNAEVAAGPFETTLHTDDLPAGMYYLVLRTKAGTFSKAISVVR